jgi:ribosomal protein S18 acetylase RimI-like enzyme
VIAIGVDPRFRVRRTGEKLFDAMCDCLRADGVATVRTMVARADRLDMAFFRAQGMMAGPFIELEKPLD